MKSDYIFHDDVIKWKQFPRNCPFVRGIHRFWWIPGDFPARQWRGALMFSLICARINGWVNNREAGDLRRRPIHCDVIVMQCVYLETIEFVGYMIIIRLFDVRRVSMFGMYIYIYIYIHIYENNICFETKICTSHKSLFTLYKVLFD